MANITNFLNKIKTAVHGKDVRGAIHDAIKQVYDDASVEHDNANMEVKLARGTHNTLNDRLDNVDEIQAQTNAQLSSVKNEKANKTDVRYNDVPIRMNDLHTEIKQAMTGGSVAVVGENAVGTENLKDSSVTINKLNVKGLHAVQLHGYDLVDIDTINKTVTIPNNFRITVDGIVKGTTGDKIISYNASQINHIIYDLSDDTYKCITNGENDIKKNHVHILSIWGTRVTSSVRYSKNGIPTTLDCDNELPLNKIPKLSKDKLPSIDLSFIDKSFVWGVVGQALGKVPFDFDFANKRVTVNDHAYIVTDSRRFFYVGGGESFTIDWTNVSGVRYLVYDYVANEVKVAGEKENSLGASSYIVLATWWSHDDWRTLNCPSLYTINGEMYDVHKQRKLSDYALKSELPDIDSIVSETPFNKVDNRLVLPPVIYGVSGQELPIYRDNIMYKIDGSQKVSTVIFSENPTRYEYLDTKMKYLNLSKFGKTLKFGLETTSTPPSKYLMLDVDRCIVEPNSKTGTSINLLCIGDSITNRNIAKFTIEKLKSRHGVDAKGVGTIISNGTKNEGREGWELANYIGMDNWYGLDNSQESYNWEIKIPESNWETDPSGTYSKWNPFLKLATEQDKLEHPTWCFRNTGSGKELSYADDSDKTGDFYIFDFANYMRNHNVSAPDVITIALGRNDIMQQWDCNTGREDLFNRMTFCLNVIVRQIKKALPNVKIGIVPDIYRKDIDWIERCIYEIKQLQNDLSEIYCIPVWCHVNGYWGYQFENGAQIHELNNEKEYSVTETTHIVEIAQHEYADVMTNFIVNII